MLRYLAPALAWLSMLVPGWALATPAAANAMCDASNERVVLLHGMLRSAWSMRSMEAGLKKAGYTVHNIDYPSREYPVEELVPLVFDDLRDELASADCKVHFVTHSLGGILVRHYLAHHPSPPGLGRVVMLGPPNQGSEVVDALGDWALFNWVNGPAGRQLGTDENSVPQRLGPVDFELGVIAGNRSINLILSQLIPGPDDGKVSVERAQVAGMQDFIVVPYTHVFMMTRPEVIRQTVHFLRQGRFDHEAAEA